MCKFRNLVLVIVLVVGAKLVFSQSNSMKIGLLGASIGDYSFGFEQMIDETHTMNFNIGYMDLNSALINVEYFLKGEDKLWVDRAGAGWHGSVEMRNYFTLRPNTKGNAFYWGPYFRLWNNSLLLNDYIKNDLITERQLFEAETRFNGVGVGLQLGYQWMLAERFWIDFYFLGAGFERIRMKTIYRAIGIDDFDYTAIKGDVVEAFEDQADFIKNNVEVRTSDNLLVIDLPFVMYSFRAGINIAFVLD